jgi:hypothetical protein
MPGRPTKEFHDYLTKATSSHVSHSDYLVSPAWAFLKYLIEAKSAIDLCIRKFPKNQDGRYTKNSLDSLQHLIVAVLPAIMGHFETYERYLFAGIFDLSVYLSGFKVENFFKKLSTVTNVSIDLIRLSAHRALGASSIGSLLADSLSGWHDPVRVIGFFKAFDLKYTLFSNDDCGRLIVLWQLRHSIVHTGGTLTLPDAQKVLGLKSHGGNQVAFENNFIFEVARKLHPIIKNATGGIGSKFKQGMLQNLDQATLDRINEFFDVKSSVPVWLK